MNYYSHNHLKFKFDRYEFFENKFFGISDFVGFNKLSIGLISQYGDIFPIESPKFSSGIEIRAKGFLFYGYPAAITLEHHFPILLDEINLNDGKTYMKFLFDF